jgi:hypothetical protein
MQQQSAKKDSYASESYQLPVPQISPAKPTEETKKEDKTVVIEDDMMIFCVL